jgi:hypothetical protein
VNDYEELARRAEHGELPVKAGTILRHSEGAAHIQQLLMDATGAATIDGAVAAALNADRD